MRPAWANSELASDTCYEVGDLLLCPLQRTVQRDGVEIPLGKLTFELLLLLVESAPNLVTLEEITQTLWADRVVSEDTVRQRVKLLRKALSDDSANPRYVNVVRGQGVRLIPEVRGPGDERRHLSRGKTAAALAVATCLVLAGAGVALWAGPATTVSKTEPQSQSIAVLPFETLSSEPDDAFFVDGFHNDLLTHLARIDELSVISRTSVIEYRNGSKNLRQIGEELGVSSILEGSVQRSGSSVRINAQLIDARSDHHLWAEVYDRQVTAENLFDIQSEMAGAITLALQLELSPEAGTSIREVSTANTAAYNHYLLGLHHLETGMRHDAFYSAAEAFEAAVDEDPEFALAWAALARSHSALYFFDDRTESRRDKSRAAVDFALELQPDLPEAHMALGFYRYHTSRDYEGALEAWETAELGMPGDSRLIEARAIVYARMGDAAQSLRFYEQAAELDPRNIGMLVAMAWQYGLAGDLASAEEVLRNVLRMAPGRAEAHRRLAYLPMWRNGDGQGLRAVLDSAPIPVRAPPMEWLASIYERDFDGALAMLDEWNFDAVDAPMVYRPISWFYGTTLKIAGESERAQEYFHRAEDELEELLVKHPADPRMMITLADVRGHLGKTRLAVELAEQVLDAIPVTLDANLGPRFQLHAVMAFLAVGDHESAVTGLDSYLSSPSVWTIDGLLPDPRLDPIREYADFIELVDRHRARDVRLASN